MLIKEQDKEVGSTERLWQYAGAIFGALFCMYLWTAFPGVGPRDSAEIPTYVSKLQLLHPPGYPLAVLIGKALTSLPLGGIGYRANLISVIFGAAAGGMFFLILTTLTKRDTVDKDGANAKWLIIPCLYFATSKLIWRNTTSAEVFMLNIFIVAAIFYVTVVDISARAKIPLNIFLLGLGVSNHHTVIFSIPFILYTVMDRNSREKISIRELWSTPLILIAALSSYPALYFRDKSLFSISAWRGLTALFLRESFGTFRLASQFTQSRAAGAQDTLAMLSNFFNTISEALTIVGSVLALVGLFSLYSRNRRLSHAVLFSFLLSGPVFIILARIPFDIHGVATIERFYLMPYFVAAICAGVGFIEVVQMSNRLNPSTGGAVAFAVAALVLFRTAAGGLDISRRNCFVVEDYLRNLSVALKRDAVVAARGDTSIFLGEYLRVSRRPDIDLVHAPIVFSSDDVTRRMPLSPPVGYGEKPIYTLNILRSEFLKTSEVGLLPYGPVSRFVPTPLAIADKSWASFPEFLTNRTNSQDVEGDIFLGEFFFTDALGKKYLGDKYLDTGKYDEAHSAYTSMRANFYESETVQTSLSAIAALEHHRLGRGMATDARELRLILSEFESLPTSQLKNNSKVMAALAYYDLQEYDRALAMCNNIDSEDFRRYSIAGSVYAKRGDFNNAVGSYSRALELNPMARDVRNNLENILGKTRGR